MSTCPIHHHGVSKSRGCEHVAASHFSRLFPDLNSLTLTEEHAIAMGGPGRLMHDYDGQSPDCGIPAAYIFFSQFIDHDITLDTGSGLRDAPRTPAQVAELANIRSPSLDLDCVYGFGPEASPHIYDADNPGRLAIAPNGYDLARSPGGTALIGDPRNDENIFVAQMQLLFHRFHNRIYNERIHQEDPKLPFNRFEEAQKQTRYHYQWLVLFDFLKRLCDPKVYAYAAKKLVAGDKKFPHFYKPDKCHGLSMPVEFSVAAYRVGHTLVRSSYAVNGSHLDVELFDDAFATQGFGPIPEDLVVDWRYLLPVADCIRPRMCKAIDPFFADELQDLPVVPSNNPIDRALACRNLLRGNAMGLPSGQDVAKALQAAGYPVGAPIANWTELSGIHASLAKATPLFYYVLRESQATHGGQRFGPVGSAILMEVFGGMLSYCNTSFLKHKDWQPDPCISKEKYYWWQEEYVDGFSHKALIEQPDYYPFELADVVRFVEGID